MNNDEILKEYKDFVWGKRNKKGDIDISEDEEDNSSFSFSFSFDILHPCYERLHNVEGIAESDSAMTDSFLICELCSHTQGAFA